MQLGLRGAQEFVNSMGTLQAASKFWNPGDKVVYIFPVIKDAKGRNDIPVFYGLGHSVDFSKDSPFKRSFIPTMSELDVDNRIVKPDFAAKVHQIFRALLNAEKAFEIEEAKKRQGEDAVNFRLKQIEDDFKKKYPKVSRLSPRIYTEVLVGKMDINGRLVMSGNTLDLNYASMQISPSRMRQLFRHLDNPESYDGKGYLVVTLQTENVPEKKLAGKGDYNPIVDPTKKLEVLHPDFEAYVKGVFESRQPTTETIKSKLFDFQSYDLGLFQTAVASEIQKASFLLKDANGNYREDFLHEDKIDVLTAIGMVAPAEEIKRIMQTKSTEESQSTPEMAAPGQQAQGLDIVDSLNLGAPPVNPGQAV